MTISVLRGAGRAFLAAGLLATAGCGGSVALVDGALCPPGSSFNIRPFGLSAFAGGPDAPFKRQTIDLASHPQARCNDGSPAVFYFRPGNHTFAGAAGGPATTEWLVFLDGGGSCGDADSCFIERWCSNGGRVFDRAGKMSSRGAWPAIASPGGVFDPSPGPGAGMPNVLAERNQVFVHYCSSDTWVGSEEHQALTTGFGLPYDIEFRGEAIVNAVFETLLAGPVTGDPAAVATPGIYPEDLPSLSDATDILLGGESAGGGGLRHHIDRLNDSLAGSICPKGGECALAVRGVIDAGAPPGLWGGGISWADPASPASYADYLQTEAAPRLRTFWGAEDAALDASCLDPAHAVQHNTYGSHPEVCYDTTYTLERHITTPIFLRQDINDTLARQKYADWVLFLSGFDFMTAQRDQLAKLGASPHEPGFASFDRGVLGNKCDEHVTIQRSGPYFRWRVNDPAYPSPLSFHQLLVNWLGGSPAGSLTRQVQGDNPALPGYSASSCP